MNNRKIAFHFYNDGIPDVDFANVEDGNPGVGGTVFLAVLIPKLLAKRGVVSVKLLVNKECNNIEGVDCEVCGDVLGALNYCRNHKDIDAIVIDCKRINTKTIKQFSDVNIIVWANNFIKLSLLREMANCSNIVRIVNVGREQYDLYRDMKVFRKSTYIFNAFPLNNILHYRKNSTSVSKRKHHVVYVGSITPLKGMHLLAKAWPQVLKVVPDAELFIIGGGNLYRRKEELGKWGIASKSYESKFMPYLTKDGLILPSVHFLGVMGIEKFDVISKCKVGVPNPSGYTETFGYTAIEMQAMGCWVTTRRCPGYLDTVYDDSALYDNVEDLAKFIVKYLLSNEDQPKAVMDWIRDQFDNDVLAEEWERLLNSDFRTDADVYPVKQENSNYRGKKLKEWIRVNVPDCLKCLLIPIDFFYPSLNGLNLISKIYNGFMRRIGF